MTPKAIISYIANVRTDIDERIERLAKINRQPAASAGAPFSSSVDVLDALLGEQLANAMDGIRAINNVGNSPAHKSETVFDLSPADYNVVRK